MSRPEPDSEDALLSALVELLGLTGWRAYHVRRSDKAIVQGMGGAGFPDIIAAHPGTRRMIAIECKSNIGVPTPDQLAWLFAFRHLGTVEATIVRPASYDDAIRWIRGTGPVPDARVVEP